MTKNKRMIEAIHKGALADLAAVRSEPEPPRHRTWEHRTWRDRQDNAGNNIVELNASLWLGMERMEPATSMSVSRAYRAGEQAGLWHRVVENGKTVGLLLVEGVDDGE